MASTLDRIGCWLRQSATGRWIGSRLGAAYIWLALFAFWALIWFWIFAVSNRLAVVITDMDLALMAPLDLHHE